MTAEQGVRDSEHTAEASGAVADEPQQATGVARLIQRLMTLKPVRVYLHYNTENGPLIATGMSYQAVFALFAALWLAFSILGFVLKGDAALQEQLFTAINRFIPQLIGYTAGTTHHSGLIDADSILSTSGLSWSSAVSLVGVLFTAVGFLSTLRTAVRIMFGLPGPTENPVLLKLKDIGYTFAFGAAVLLTGVISVLSNTVLGTVLGALGLRATPLSGFAVSASAFVVLALVDSALTAAAFRILSGVPIPRGRLWAGSVISGVGLAALQTLGSALLGGARSNPIIGAFATLIGIFIYFNFVCQVLLLAASWIAVGMTDAHLDPRDLSPEQRQVHQAEELEQARRLVAKANRHALEDRIRASRGLRRWRLVKQLQREEREETRREARVPTVSEFREAQKTVGDLDPDAQQVAEVRDAERQHAPH